MDPIEYQIRCKRGKFHSFNEPLDAVEQHMWFQEARVIWEVYGLGTPETITAVLKAEMEHKLPPEWAVRGFMEELSKRLKEPE